MRYNLLCSAALLIGSSAVLAGQQPKPAPQPKQAGAAMAKTARKYAAFAGVWKGKSMIGPKDSVVTTYTLTINPNTGGGIMKFPTRKPVAVKAVAMGGDSLVTETAKYPSLLRKGQMVTVRTTSHVEGDRMHGTFVAIYSDGSTTRGKMEGVRAGKQ